MNGKSLCVFNREATVKGKRRLANMTSSSSDVKGTLAKLEEISQQHESNIVIELGVDRLVKWIGVYLMLTLSVVFKIINYIGPNLSCYPANQISGTDNNFIVFSNAYCWESLHDLDSKNCEALNVTNAITLLENPNDVKNFIQWLPYIILVQAFLFAAPVSWWHFRVGARLMGHLKFMQLLLEDIYKQLQTLPKVPDLMEPYDQHSEYLDGCRKAKVEKNSELTIVKTDTSERIKRKSITKKYKSENTEESTSMKDDATPNSNIFCGCCKRCCSDCLDELITGDMRDRHLFSMFCYENFASLHHIPYILSVFKLCEADPKKGQEKRPTYDSHLNESMLHQWCHRDNFNHNFLVKAYFLKHIYSAFVSCVMVVTLCCCFVVIADDIRLSETFRCQLPYHDICLLCTIRRKRDLIAMMACDLLISFFVFITSFVYWLVLRSSFKNTACRFFETMEETCNVALAAVKLRQQKAE